jgi:type IV pilus assembly protein PilB
LGRAGRLSAAIWTALPTAALAADDAGWPALVPPGWEKRGAGGGMAIVPAVLWWLVVLGWLRTLDWVSTDSRKHGLRPAFWGAVCGAPLPLAALLAWWIPWSWLALPLMLIAWLAPAVTYSLLRNPRVAESERVLTQGHARRLLAGLLAPLGIEVDTATSAEELLPVVSLSAAGGVDAEENQSREKRAAALPGFEEARRMMQAAVVARAATFDIECDTEGTTVRHEVDGVWEKPRIRKPPRTRKEKESWVEAPKSSREVGEAVLAALRALCGLAPGTRGNPPAPFFMQVDGKPRICRLLIRGTTAGERAVVQFDAPATVYKKLADLGMPADLVTRTEKLLALEAGIIVLSAPPASGLTTTFDVLVLSADRLLRDFISLEDAAAPPREIQNVKPVRFDSRTGVSPLDALAPALREYPRAIVTRDIRDKPLLAELVRLATESNMLVIMSMKATDATDAVVRLVAAGLPPQQLARALLGSLSQRLIRKLCPKCREAFPPPAELMARLKATPEQLSGLRRASPEGCRVCGGTGYLGRTAIFELASGSTFRQALANNAADKILRQAAIKEGMRPFADAALAAVLEGMTSLEERQRVLAPVASPAPAGASPVAKPAAKPPAKGGNTR